MLRFADVDAEHGRALARRRQALALQQAPGRLGADIVETHAVQRRPLRRQSKQPRAGITGLTMPGDCAQFGEAKAELMPDASGNAIFVKARRQAHRVGETTAKQALLQAWIGAL